MDPVGLYAEAMIREYLSKRGCTRTLAAFDAEQPRTSDSISSKLQIVKGLKLAKLVQKNKDKADGGYATLLEMLVEYMHGKAAASGGGDPGDAAPAARSDRPGSGPGRKDSTALGPSPPPAAPSPVRKVPTSASGKGWNVEEEPTPVVERAAIRVAPAPAPASRFRSDLTPAASAPVGSVSRAQDPRSDRPAGRRQSNNWASGELEMADVDDEIEGMHISGRSGLGPSGGAYRPSAGPSAVRGAEPLSADEGRELRKLIFGSATGTDFSAAWRQGLFFSDNLHLRYGLVQNEGGPCGVLAAIQAFILKYVAFSLRDEAPQRPPQPTATERERALVEALCEIVWQAGDRRRARFALYAPDATGGRVRDDRFSIVELSGADALRALLASRLPQLQDRGGCGVIMVLYSAVLTRGVAAVRKDMDMPDSTLIGSHGYCTQELVNLLLVGRAHSNVFDGERRLDEQVLRGIPRRSDVGYLTLFETYKYVEVGKHYKIPTHPIWVICSESHYTVLFSMDRRLVDESVRVPARFDLFYYDELARQEEEIRLTIDTRGPAPSVDLNSKTDLTPPIENCIRTKWPTAKVDWNGTEPLL